MANTAISVINNIANTAIQHKLSRYVDTSMSLVQNGIYGTGNTLMTVTNLANEFRPYYEVKSNYMIWYDFAVIKLNHLFESLIGSHRSHPEIRCVSSFMAQLRYSKCNCSKCWNCSKYAL